MSESVWYMLPVNPEPWAIGPVGTSRRNGKMSAYVGRNQQLDAYKEAIKEAIQLIQPNPVMSLLVPPYELEFWFWRNRAAYQTPSEREHRKHVADSTNMQKATEDALQGLVIGNDRDVAKVTSQIVAQGPDVEGRVLIRAVGNYEIHVPPEIDEMYDVSLNKVETTGDRNVWPPRR